MAAESELESWCRERTTKAGGYLLKWVSPGNKGVPDRILLMPEGRIAFIEFKGPRGQLDPLQEVWQRRLTTIGQKAYVVRDKAGFLFVLETLAT